ncbi:helix-turn-helix domain-containing protein [Arthrobacter sp. H5]|uniref:winged helix-turn-helix transcriptional regulator n=1 Tax=Arthrobacter sp. H5 TaxID=1267973 RepID=UPI0009DF252C|nr:helix-turn-helix domain-containing protein [Arthrobacter sp. H5]
MRKAVASAVNNCTLEVATAVVGGAWKLTIVKHVLASTRRFGELGRLMPGITPRMLTRQLRELEADGVIVRTVYAQVPPKVEYSPSELGRSLAPLVADLEKWGTMYSGSLPHQPQEPGSPLNGPTTRDVIQPP